MLGCSRIMVLLVAWNGENSKLRHDTAGLCALKDVLGRGFVQVPGDDGGDFAHWEACSEGTLYNTSPPQCTNPHRNVAISVQSRQRREAPCTKPHPNRVATVQSRTLLTRGVVSEEVCTVTTGNSVQSPVSTRSPVYKVDRTENPGVQTPVSARLPVCKAARVEKWPRLRGCALAASG